MRKISVFKLVALVLVLCGLLVSGNAFAVTYNLTAVKGCISLPDGTITEVLPCPAGTTAMWGLKRNDTGRWLFEAGQALTVADGALTVNLTNNLGVPTSLWLPGQTLTNNTGPVWFTSADSHTVPANPYVAPTLTGTRGANLTARVRSFAHEVAPAATAAYTWATVKPGTFILQSGTQPALQVPMGMYGAVTVTGGGYPGTAFDVETLLLFSEIDPAINNIVTDANAGVTGTFHYKPQYFLVNGKPFTPGVTPLVAGTAAQTTLVRLANAGLFNHTAMMLGEYMTVRAEDGNIYPVTKQNALNTVLLTAGKTIDATFAPASAGYYPLFDRRLYLANNAAPSGGMMSYLRVPSGVDATLTVTAATEGPAAAPGAGKVIAASAPGGISCSAPLAAPDTVCGPTTINSGTKVALAAAGAPGSIGRLVPTVPVASCKAKGPCEIDITGGITVNAFFRPLSNLAVYDGNATWYVDKTGTNAWEGLPSDASPFFGFTGATPVSGDWNGNGLAKIGVYANANWYLDTNNNGVWDGTPTDATYFFGFPGATPVTGDWDGSGVTKIGVFANGNWYLDMNGNGVWDGVPTDKTCSFGFDGTTPVTGDWTGSGITKVGIYYNATWYLDMDGDCAWNPANDAQYVFGFDGVVPVASDWNNDGKTKIGVFHNGTWYLDVNGNGVWDGASTDASYIFGFTGAMPVAAHW